MTGATLSCRTNRKTKNKMKRTIFLLSAALCLAAGCDKVPSGLSAGADTELTVTLSGLSGPDGTKATGGTAAENKVNNLTVYVFDANGMLDVSHACTATEIAAGKATIRTKTGAKTVCAAANLGSGVAAQASGAFRLADLAAVPYALSDNGRSSLTMWGTAAGVNVVSGTGGSVTVKLARGVARVSLGSVRNALPAPFGPVKLKHAFLCNVVGNQNLGGDAVPDNAKYLNREATVGHVRTRVVGTGSNEAECKDLTFQTLGEEVAVGAAASYTNKFFYGFPNALTTPNNGFHATFVPTATVLMVVATIRGVDYYYPVPLSGGLAANTEYKVDLTLAGLGNTGDDPFARIEKADLSATIQVSPWNTGAGISETI